MDLYFLPLACSMATRIGLSEAELEANFIEVDSLTKRVLDDGSDFLVVNPLGLVPVLRRDDGALLTENVAVLQYIASLAPGRLAPSSVSGQLELTRWLAFIASELHAGVFGPLVARGIPAAVREHAVSKSTSRLEHLDQHLAGRTTLLDEVSVADAYLWTVLNWERATPIDLQRYPHVHNYLAEGRKRPSVREAIATEMPLFLAEQARQKQAAAGAST